MLISVNTSMKNKHVVVYYKISSLLDVETKFPAVAHCDNRKHNKILTDLFSQLACNIGNSNFLNDKITIFHN